MTKPFSFLLTSLLLLFAAGTASGQVSKNSNFKPLRLSQIRSYSAAVIDDGTGQVLFAKRENDEKPVASITKILGANVFLTTNPNLNSKVKMESADEVGGGRLRLPVGTTTQARNFLYSSLVGSANNSATALVRLSGLGKNTFIRRMNSLADSVGASGAKFVDASGISPSNLASAKELALIGRRVYSNSYLCKVSATRNYSFSINGGRGTKSIVHTSPIVNRSESAFKVLAAKTGYLPEVGNNLLVKLQSKRNGKAKIIVVLMGAITRNATTLDASKLGNWAFINYKW